MGTPEEDVAAAEASKKAEEAAKAAAAAAPAPVVKRKMNPKARRALKEYRERKELEKSHTPPERGSGAWLLLLPLLLVVGLLVWIKKRGVKNGK